MAELSIDPDYLRMLILKVRGLMAKEAVSVPDDASNEIDDDMPASALQDEQSDLTRDEIVAKIRGLEPQERAELVALMWLGRDEASSEDWQELVQRALERQEIPTEDYLLHEPLVAEYWLEGMERLGLGGLLDGVEAI
jgi:hypothetical protein